MNALLAGVEGILHKYRGTPALSDKNLKTFMSCIISFISTTLEAHLMRKEFSQIGALLFDKEIRLLVTHVSSLYDTDDGETAKDKFANLLLISTLLNLDSPHDIANVWGSDTKRWKMKPSKARDILLLRSDTNDEVVNEIFVPTSK
jgi:hypothetical protein